MDNFQENAIMATGGGGGRVLLEDGRGLLLSGARSRRNGRVRVGSLINGGGGGVLLLNGGRRVGSLFNGGALLNGEGGVVPIGLLVYNHEVGPPNGGGVDGGLPYSVGGDGGGVGGGGDRALPYSVGGDVGGDVGGGVGGGGDGALPYSVDGDGGGVGGGGDGALPYSVGGGDGRLSLIGRGGGGGISQSQTQPPRQDSNWSHRLSKHLHLAFWAAVVFIYAPLVTLCQWVTKMENKSPLKTHGFFIITSVVSLVIASIASVFLSYHLETSTDDSNFPPTYFFIEKTVFYFAGILAPFSLVLVILIPHTHNWIGYLMISLVFGGVVAWNFYGYLRDKNNQNVSGNHMV